MIKKLLVIVALALCLGTWATPEPARANDDLVYIIPAAVGGVVAVVVIIAILMADRTDPEFELHRQALPTEPAPPALRVGLDCPPSAAGQPLLCW